MSSCRAPVAHSGRWVAALLAGLAIGASAAAQPADPEAWTTVRSTHFELHSDADPERGIEIVRSLETFRAVFAGLAPAVELRSPAPTRIYAFRDAESFAPYKTAADAEGVKILGQFLTHRDGNYITLNADPRYLGSFAVILHEYVHYLVQSNFPRVPLWFNEGLAEYYSTFAVEGSTAVVGRAVDRHRRWLAGNAELRLAEVLAEARQAGGFNEAEKAGRFYAVSWGLVHYLLSSDDGAGRLADFLARLAEGEGGLGAFESAFAVRPSAMEEELRRYLLGPELPVAVIPLERLPGMPAPAVEPDWTAEVLLGLGDLLAHMGREAAAERHIDLARELAPDHPDVPAGLAYVRDRQGRTAEAEELFREAATRGSRSALTWLLYGRHLLQVMQSAEAGGDGEAESRATARRARDAFARAVELDPGFAEARAMLGYAHLFGGLDAAAGLPYLEQARAQLPARTDLLLHILQALLRSGEIARAEALAEGDVRRLGTPEMYDRAREEIERWTLIGAAREAIEAGEVERGLRLFDQAISATSDPQLRSRMEERLETLRHRLAGGR